MALGQIKTMASDMVVSLIIFHNCDVLIKLLFKLKSDMKNYLSDTD